MLLFWLENNTNFNNNNDSNIIFFTMSKLKAQTLIACTGLICATILAVKGIKGWDG
jgi:hypothetical protein